MTGKLEAPPVLSTPDTHIFEDPTPPVAKQIPLSDEEAFIIYEIERTVKELKEGRWCRIALQFPDDMLVDAPRVFEALSRGLNVNKKGENATQGPRNRCQTDKYKEKEICKDGSAVGASTHSAQDEEIKLCILGDTSYGACCVDEVAAEHIHADVVIHYGRSCLSPTARLPVIYVFTKRSLQMDSLLQAFMETYPEKDRKIILMADVVYIHYISEIKEKLLLEGYSQLFFPEIVHDPSSLIPNRTVPPDVTKLAERLRDWELFHISLPPDSLLLTLSSRVSSIHVYPTNTDSPTTSKAILTSTKLALRRRYALLTSLNTASIFGILINTLSVKNYLHMVEHVKEQIRKAGKKSYTFVVGKVNAAKIANFSEIGGWVVIGCWESSLIESKDFWKPVITPFELGLALQQDSERIWTGEWKGDFQSVLDETQYKVMNSAANQQQEAIPAGQEEPGDEDHVDGGDLDSEPESAPPEFDLRTGRYVSHTRPMQEPATLSLREMTANGGSRTSMTAVMKRATGDVAIIGGAVSPGAEFLKTQRMWRGLGSDFGTLQDGEGSMNEPEGASIEQGRSGIARGYTVGESAAKI
ncbi:MAG: Diphthamide biosynthesis protein 2 [Cirrosporium novae-zelandiae]|nr:MAG: Diphthamide biosynthesis protein 2 [Cirrosporium novae-zelandiae]